jgi:class 3 adenylate cyclase
MIEGYWQVPEAHANLERLAERRRVVQFDGRGIGLSRDVTDFSLEARVCDLAAVIEGLDVPAVDLFSQAHGGPVAISYAVKNPQTVGRLLLGDAVANGRDVIYPPRARALRPLIDVDWELWVQTQVLVMFGWTEIGRRVAEASVSSMTSEVFVASQRAARREDVSDLLPDLSCPTLVMQLRDERVVSLETSRRVAATIPNARLALYDQQHQWVLAGEAGVRIIEDFLDEGADIAAAAAHPEHVEGPSGTAIILFADIADSTALTESLGDAAFRKKARELDAALRAAIRECGGTPVEGPTLGDGVLAAFASAREAIEAGLRSASAGAAAGLPLHLGIHAGDVTREKDADGRANIYGGAVNVASRIAGLSAPGEVLVSETVRSLARTSAGVWFEDRGEQELMGVGEAVRVWAVSQRMESG